MINDEALRAVVSKYDARNKDYNAIVYVCLEAGAGDTMAASATAFALSGLAGAAVGGALGGLANDWSIMTVSDDGLWFYILDKFKMSPVVTRQLSVPYNAITKMRIRKFLIWTSIKIHFANGHKRHKLKVLASSKCVGIKRQKENLNILLDCLRSNIP